MNILNDFFVALYEKFGIIGPFGEIFNVLYLNNSYLYLGMLFIIIPLIGSILFYFFYKNPYSKWFHWVFLLIVVLIIVLISTIERANRYIFASPDIQLINLLNDNMQAYAFAQSLVIKFVIANSILATLTFIIFSLIAKQFSKHQGHLPY